MFAPRLGSYPAPQKNRHYRMTPFRFVGRSGPWTEFVALGQGAITQPFLEKLYLWGKKTSRFPNKTMRFWVNLQVSRVLTKKPVNLRMGKGKGGRVGAIAPVSAGNVLLALSFLRPGLLGKLKRQISVRAPFKVGCHVASPYLRYKQQSTYRTQRRYTSYTMYDLRYFFRKSNQTHSYAFIKSLVRWARKVPRLNKLARVAGVYVPDEYDDYYALETVSALTTTKFLWGSILYRDRTVFVLPHSVVKLTQLSGQIIGLLLPPTEETEWDLAAAATPYRLLFVFFEGHPLFANPWKGATAGDLWLTSPKILARLLWSMTALDVNLHAFLTQRTAAVRCSTFLKGLGCPFLALSQKHAHTPKLRSRDFSKDLGPCSA